MSQNAMSSQGIFRGRKTLSVMPTYTCTAACTNCASMSTPKVREQIELATILDAIDQAKSLDFYNVVFTGGEATLRWKDLLAAISYAHGLGFPTRLVTNAHWAVSTYSANRVLQALIECGLDEINYSTGDEHVRFVPLQRVVNACVAAAACAFRVWVMVELRDKRVVTATSIREHPLIAALPQAQHDLIEVSENPWMPLDPLSIEQYPAGTAAQPISLKSHLPCSNVLQTYTVQADGRVGAYCGIGMRKIPELNVSTVETSGFLAKAIQEAEGDFLKLWIHYKGPEQVLAWAAKKDDSIKWEGLYAHRCQSCARVYKDEAVGRVIREHYEEIIAEVLQTAWIDEEYLPRMTASLCDPSNAWDTALNNSDK